MDETIYILLEGGTVMPISHVTAAHTPSNVVVYDGETYRDNMDETLVAKAQLSIAGPSYNIAALTAETAPTVPPTGALSDAILKTGTGNFYTLSDIAAHIAPRYKGKQRTIWTFTRGTDFPHVVWADQVIGTSSHAPFQIGMTPTSVS